MIWIVLASLCVGILTLALLIEQRSHEQAPQLRRRIINRIRSLSRELHSTGRTDHDPVRTLTLLKERQTLINVLKAVNDLENEYNI